MEGFGVGCVRGWTTLLSSSHRLNIDILEWLFSKKACFTVCKELVEQEVIYWLFPLDGLTSLQCLDLLHFIL